MTLDQLAITHKADKSSAHHGYCATYEKYFEPMRDKDITLIEAGVGGYQYPDRGGNSARMFREYFTRARIITFDIHPKHPINGVEVLQGGQVDAEFINGLPECDVFIDDASHQNQLTVKTFHLAWSKVKAGGLYIIEDVHTSYWDEHGYGGDANVFELNSQTTMNEFLFMAHMLNREHIKYDRAPIPFKQYPNNVAFIHFYSKLIVVGKQ